MGRLIDADKLKEYINGEVFMGKLSKAYLKNIVNKQPVTFDIEEVVKELEKMKLVRVEQCHEDYEIEVMTASNFDDAIEIVRKGGVK